MKSENEEMRAEFEKWADSVDIDIRRRYDGSNFYIYGATWKAWLSWQAAWSASRKGIPLEAMRDAIDLFRDHADAMAGHLLRKQIYLQHAAALESLLPAEKESDHG